MRRGRVHARGADRGAGGAGRPRRLARCCGPARASPSAPPTASIPAISSRRGRGSTRLMSPPTMKWSTSMLALAEVRPDEKVVDLGSGDGRILIAAARSSARAASASTSIRRGSARPMPMPAPPASRHRVIFRREDLFETPIRDADVSPSICSQEINIRLRPRILAEMRPGTRVVSHDFDMGDWPHDAAAARSAAPASISGSSRPGSSGRWTMNLDGRPAELEHRPALPAVHRRARPSAASRRGSSRAGSTAAQYPLRRARRRRRAARLRRAGATATRWSGANWRASRAPADAPAPTPCARARRACGLWRRCCCSAARRWDRALLVAALCRRATRAGAAARAG